MKQLGKVTQDKAQYGQVLKGLITQVGGFNQNKYSTYSCHEVHYSSVFYHRIFKEMYVWVWLGHRVFLTWEMIMFFKLFIKYFYFPSCSGGTVSIHHSFTPSPSKPRSAIFFKWYKSTSGMPNRQKGKRFVSIQWNRVHDNDILTLAGCIGQPSTKAILQSIAPFHSWLSKTVETKNCGNIED